MRRFKSARFVFFGLRLLESSSVKSAFLRLWNRSTQMSLVRHDAALFQDQLQSPYVGDVLERIGPDHNQVGKLECSTRMCTRSNHP